MFVGNGKKEFSIKVVSFFPVIDDDLSNTDNMYKLIDDNLNNEIKLAYASAIAERKKFIE